MSAQRRIVVGFDGSADSWAAVRYAAAEAAGNGGQLQLLHALLGRSAYAAMALPGPVAEAPVEARRLVDTAGDELRGEHPGLEVHGVVVVRSAGPALIRASRWAEMTVLGRHGHGRAAAASEFRRVHVGKVVARVLAGAVSPVVVGPTTVTGGGPVVLGLDANTASDAPIAYAFDMAQRHGTTLRVCFVRVPPGVGSGGADEPRGDAEARQLLSTDLLPWRNAFADVAVALDVLQGFDPAARLLDTAMDASLIVVGARERTGARSTGSGRVAEMLVRNAVCPVAVVRGHRQPARDARFRRAGTLVTPAGDIGH